MIAQRVTPLVELDRRASVAEAPVGIITADCTGAHEYDDGIAIEALPSATELYRVSVFAADTSPLYGNEDIMRDVLRKTTSVYRNERTPVEAYDPMLPEGIVRRLHFSRGNTRSALVVSFIIGQDHPPDDVTIGFGQVEVNRNYNYKKFGEKCRYSDNLKAFGRAAAYILHYLGPEPGSMDDDYRNLIHVLPQEVFRRGANINQAFMVAANHLVGSQMEREERPAIYRVHDPFNPDFTEFVSPRLARFSAIPGRHKGLGLDVYTRVTSPLRRAEDFVMSGLLRARDTDRPLGKRDRRIVASAVQRLNQHIISSAFEGSLPLRDEDLWTMAPDEVAREQDAERMVLVD